MTEIFKGKLVDLLTHRVVIITRNYKFSNTFCFRSNGISNDWQTRRSSGVPYLTLYVVRQTTRLTRQWIPRGSVYFHSLKPTTFKIPNERQTVGLSLSNEMRKLVALFGSKLHLTLWANAPRDLMILCAFLWRFNAIYQRCTSGSMIEVCVYHRQRRQRAPCAPAGRCWDVSGRLRAPPWPGRAGPCRSGRGRMARYLFERATHGDDDDDDETDDRCLASTSNCVNHVVSRSAGYDVGAIAPVG